MLELSDRYVLAINKETTDQLRSFIKDELKIKPGFVMTEVVHCAIRFALDHDGEFKEFLKGKVIAD